MFPPVCYTNNIGANVTGNITVIKILTTLGKTQDSDT